MITVVGGYQHPDNMTWVSPLIMRRVPTKRGRRLMYNHRWTIHEVVLASTQAAMTTALATREAAYRNITGDVKILDNSGAQTHYISYNQSLNGIKCSAINYPGYLQHHGLKIYGSHTEYAGMRYVVYQIEADTVAVDDNILLYHQTVQSSLGGVGYKVVEAFTGFPQVQFTKQQSKFWAIQHGVAVGAFSNPNPPGPLVPAFPDPDRSWVQYGTPEIQGQLGNLAFKTEWKYYFEGPGPLLGIPPANP